MTKRSTLATLALSAAIAAVAGSGGTLHAQQTARAKEIGGKFMCMCGCTQVLTQCNHVGCTTSASMLKELDQAVARRESETTITQGFVQEFGTQVYAEPPKSGLSLVAWSMPTVYLLIGTALVILVIWRWRARPTVSVAGPRGISPEELERVRRRIAQETED
jgi:cytochrome c-type biogenesis protein CcmH